MALIRFNCFICRAHYSKILLVVMMLILFLQYLFDVSFDERDQSNNFFRTARNSEARLPHCILEPLNLVGSLNVRKEAPSIEELDKRYPKVEPRPGNFRPKDCMAGQKVAIIVPYRDRNAHLRIFLDNIHPMLQRQKIDYGIYVIEQQENTTFNRGMLMNIGFVESSKQYDWDCFIFHDVDLIPEDDRNLYICGDRPRHLSVAIDKYKYKLPYATIFGGVSALTREQFEKVNGFSNIFWGWGCEDDDLYNRVINAGYKVSSPKANVSRYQMLRHVKEIPSPSRYKKLYSGKKRFKTDGLNSLRYERLDLLVKRMYTWVYVKLQEHQATSKPTIMSKHQT